MVQQLFRTIGVLILFIFSVQSYAQVTIGSDIAPNEGALLDLKENSGTTVNASRGLLLPRVNLKNINHLYPMFDELDPNYTAAEKSIHIGLMVYNLTDEPENGLCPGPYIWKEDQKWLRLWGPCISFDITCGDHLVTGTKGTAVADGTTIQIPYILKGGYSYTIPAYTKTENGMTATIAQQILSNASGNITVTISGNPENSGIFTMPLTIGEKSCDITLDISDVVIPPPIDCINGSRPATAFVFQQGGQWYVVGLDGVYNDGGTSRSVARVYGPYTEEQALSHPKALQYCFSNNGLRCMKLYDRTGAEVGRFNMTTRSSGWLGGLVEADPPEGACQAGIRAEAGQGIYSAYYKVGYLGRVNGDYLGITSESAILSTNSLLPVE